MGHSVNYSVYPIKINKNKVQEEWNNRATYDGDGYGLPSPIVWNENKHFKNYDAARKWIEDNDRVYGQIAVTFDSPVELKESTKLKELREKHKEANRLYNEANNKLCYTPETVKSKLLTCKKCGSKLAVGYLTSNRCPVCKEDLRSPSMLKQIGSKKVKMTALAEQIRKEEAILEAKAKKETKWLVKTEYHC